MDNKHHVIAALLLAGTGVANVGSAAEVDIRKSDLWLESKLVTTYLLNEYLSPLQIDVEVRDGTAMLAGTVQNEIEKELAIDLARNIDGIRKVESSIQVDPDAWGIAAGDNTAASGPDGKADDIAAATRRTGNAFFRAVTDVTITAKVKSKLLLNEDTRGLVVNVDTDNHVVTLEGSAKSRRQKELAADIASGTEGVDKVINRLEVTGSKNNPVPAAG